MDLQNLVIGRVMLHEVARRRDDRQRVTPTYGTALEQLDASATDGLRDRVVVAMAKSDRCVQMDIMDGSPMVAVVESLVGADDALFVTESRTIPDALADAQNTRNIPGGIVVVFSGTAGVPARRLIGIIKAEVHSGFMRERVGNRLSLKFLDQLLLTPQTKLYKIGMFIEANPRAIGDQEKWSAYIYDDGMTPKERYAAALYFYESFLGLSYPDSSARQTKVFHDLTKHFLKEMDLPEEDKVDLHNALVTYLKTDQRPTVSVTAFADAYFGDAEVRDAYRAYMRDKGFPTTAVRKDTSTVMGALRLRKIVFSRNVRIVAPPDVFEELVTMRVVPGEASTPGGERPRWTQVTIKDRIVSQE